MLEQYNESIRQRNAIARNVSKMHRDLLGLFMGVLKRNSSLGNYSHKSNITEGGNQKGNKYMKTTAMTAVKVKRISGRVIETDLLELM